MLILPNIIILLMMCFLMLLAIFKEASLRYDLPLWGNRDSFFLALLTQGTLLVFITEALSAFHLFQRNYLIIGWVSIVFISVLPFAYLRTSRIGFNRNLLNFSDWKLPQLKLSLTNTVFLCLVVFQLLTLAMVAYAYPPNNWDSLTYHLSRVMHWQQDQSVASYATNITRQIQSQPFAEYELANLQIMLKSDQYANFVQLFAFFVCFIGVTSLTKKMGGSTNQQIFAGMVSISIPMAILQSTSTQNDLVTAQWLICFVLMGLNLIQEPKNYLWTIATGLSLGLACLTKATAFIFALPFCVWFGILLIRKSLKTVVAGLAIGILVLSINAGFFMRNTLLFSNPLGSTVMFDNTNEIHTFSALASNMIRNTALNFIDNQDAISRGILSWLQLLHEFSGSINPDLRISFDNTDIFSGFVDHGQVLHEDFAGNPIHAILIILTIGFLFYVYKKFKLHPYTMIYALCLISSFLLFSYYLRFQEFGSRLLLPLFILWAPVIILVLVAKNEKISGFLIAGILLVSFNWTFNNSLRGINYAALENVKNREQGYFANMPDLYPKYAEISGKISKSNCHAVGLILGENTWEYPFWVMLANRQWQGRIEHININNPTSTLEDKKFIPCAVISDHSNGKKKYSYYDLSLEFITP